MSNLADFAAGNLSPKERKVLREDAIETLEREGYIVHKPQPSSPVIELDMARIRGRKRFRLGIISDTHAGSRFQQPTFLKEHMAALKRKGVDAFVHAGDATDGSTRMHPGAEYELWAHGADAQVDAFCNDYPITGKPTYLIGGNHDASHWKAAGIDIGAAIAERRSDITYLTPGQGNALNSIGYIRLGNVSIQVCHPHLPGTRQRSYRLERWVEELTPENKPNIVLMGNFHKIVQLDYRNVYGLMLPSYQAQSSWMASKGISSYIGCCWLDIGEDARGLAPEVNQSWIVERVPAENDYPGGR